MAYLPVLYFKNTVINSDDYKKLEAENERLKAQLDREIHINRIMKKALEKYANSGYWFTYDVEENVFMCGDNGYDLAQQTLKQIEEIK